MKHYIRTFLFALMAVMILGSCKSKEEKALDQLQNMTEKIQKNGDNFTQEDWKKLYEEYSALHNKILNEKYNFTDEQMRELGKAEGTLGKAFAKQSMSEFGKAAEEFIRKGTELIKGLGESVDPEEGKK